MLARGQGPYSVQGEKHCRTILLLYYRKFVTVFATPLRSCIYFYAKRMSIHYLGLTHTCHCSHCTVEIEASCSSRMVWRPELNAHP